MPRANDQMGDTASTRAVLLYGCDHGPTTSRTTVNCVLMVTDRYSSRWRWRRRGGRFVGGEASRQPAPSPTRAVQELTVGCTAASKELPRVASEIDFFPGSIDGLRWAMTKLHHEVTWWLRGATARGEQLPGVQTGVGAVSAAGVQGCCSTPPSSMAPEHAAIGCHGAPCIYLESPWRGGPYHWYTVTAVHSNCAIRNISSTAILYIPCLTHTPLGINHACGGNRGRRWQHSRRPANAKY